jgi:hypothetical protein
LTDVSEELPAPSSGHFTVPSRQIKGMAINHSTYSVLTEMWHLLHKRSAPQLFELRLKITNVL